MPSCVRPAQRHLQRIRESYLKLAGRGIAANIGTAAQPIEREDSLAPLRREVAELRGQVSALLTLLQGAKAEVIALPRKRPSDAA